MNNRRNNVALLAALWALLFGLLHVLWATGMYVGLPAEQAKEAFKRNWFYVYNLVATSLFFLAVALAVALYIGKTTRKKFVIVCAWFCSVILLLRGTAAVLSYLYFMLDSAPNRTWITFWDIWFITGGLLFLTSTRRFQRQV